MNALFQTVHIAVALLIISVAERAYGDNIYGKNGVIYKNAEIIRNEPDGLVIRCSAT